MRHIVFGLLLSLTAFTAAAAAGDCTTVTGAVLFIDARTFGDGATPNAAFFSDTKDPNASAIVNPLTSGELDKAADAIPKGNPTAAMTRWFGTKGSPLTAVTFFTTGNDVVIHFDEVARKTRLASDFETLKKLKELASVQNVGSTTRCDVTTHTLKEIRAILSVKVRATKDTDEKAVTVAAITTGPPEYTFLSADVTLTSTKQLKFDTGSNKVSLKDTPKDFMVGFNLQLGDVYTPFPAVDWHRVVFTPMVKFSKAPLDNIGATVGYRWNNMTFFGGHFWTKEDVKTGTDAATGKDTFKTHRKGHWAAGIGYDLDAAINWVKKQ